jgi:2-deoxy-D-gluconate 3-dehydrogenase
LNSNSLFDLRKKVAVVTGGNGGIGLGCARGLAKAGASIAIWARNEEKSLAAKGELESLGIEVLVVTTDLLDRGETQAALEETLEHFGGVDILIANAGVNIRMRP